jgi:hypothetical protein
VAVHKDHVILQVLHCNHSLPTVFDDFCNMPEHAEHLNGDTLVYCIVLSNENT